MILWNHIPLFYYRDSTKIGNFSGNIFLHGFQKEEWN